MFLNERLRAIEVAAMLLSFTLIILLIVSQAQLDPSPVPLHFGAKVTGSNTWLGLALACSSAACASVAAVATRRMQNIHYTVILLHNALFAFVAISIGVGLQSFAAG